MTLADCPRCGRRELRGPSGIHLVQTRRGPVFALTCRGCGAELSAGRNLLLEPASPAAVAATAPAADAVACCA